MTRSAGVVLAFPVSPTQPASGLAMSTSRSATTTVGQVTRRWSPKRGQASAARLAVGVEASDISARSTPTSSLNPRRIETPPMPRPMSSSTSNSDDRAELADEPDIEFESDHEEQQRDADGGEQLDLRGGLDESQDLRADGDVGGEQTTINSCRRSSASALQPHRRPAPRDLFEAPDFDAWCPTRRLRATYPDGGWPRLASPGAAGLTGRDWCQECDDLHP
jgi:hypothetical protein